MKQSTFKKIDYFHGDNVEFYQIIAFFMKSIAQKSKMA
jgi:hypothetical protein